MSDESREERSRRLTAELRERLDQDAASLMIFLGAGLSFGVGRRLGRGSFETPPPIADDERFPSWLILADRMTRELAESAEDDWVKRAYERFGEEQDPLDVAQLYRSSVGEDRYLEFLDSQFETRPEDAHLLTPSHEALVALPLPEIFTTNYDGLIELASERWGAGIVVSSSPEAFLRNEAARPNRHLVKLHGTWNDHASIVLTRDDYARSRMDRAEMFRHLAQRARFATFLFVGFSLTDPNFNLIRDEARMVMGDAMPASYLVQQHVDPVTLGYLRSLDVEVIELFSWNELPRFLAAINPSV